MIDTKKLLVEFENKMRHLSKKEQLIFLNKYGFCVEEKSDAVMMEQILAQNILNSQSETTYENSWSHTAAVKVPHTNYSHKTACHSMPSIRRNTKIVQKSSATSGKKLMLK